MKNKFTAITVIMAVVSASVILTSWNNDEETMGSSGSSAGYAGDPANGNKNCTSCHSDWSPFTKAGMITSTIPGAGYTPGDTYTITGTVASPGGTTFGFEIAPQNTGGTASLGAMAPIGATETQLKTKTISAVPFSYITHKSTSNTGTGSRAWSFEWTAPATGLGPVTFYGAFNAADGDGTTAADSIFLSTMIAVENMTGITQVSSEPNFSIYPTVSSGEFTIQAGNGQAGKYNLEIYDMTGEKVHQSHISHLTSHISLNVPGGLYFVWLKTENMNTVRKIIIQ